MFISTKYIDTSNGERTPVTINTADIRTARPVKGLMGVDQWEATRIDFHDKEWTPRTIDVDYTTFTTIVEAVNAS